MLKIDSFSSVMIKKSLEPMNNKVQNPINNIEKGWDEVFHTLWQQAQTNLDKKVKQLPGNTKQLFELQRTMQSIQLLTEIGSKTAEGVSSAIKRIQRG